MTEFRSEIGARENLRIDDTGVEYLTSGVKGSYSTGEIRDRIKESRDRIPERIDILCDDVEMLYENGYFEGAEWIESWLRLMGENSEIGSDTEFNSIFNWDNGVQPPGGYTLGRKLGRMVGIMMRYREETTEDTQADIILGVLHGLRGVETPDGFLEEVEELLPHLRERAKKSAEWRTELRESIDEAESESRSTRRELRARILKQLTDRNLIELVKADKSGESSSEASTFLRQNGIEIVMAAVEEEFGADWYTSALDSGNWDRIQNLRNTHKKYQPINISTEELERIIEKHNLEQEVRFWQYIDKDRKMVQRNKWSDVSPCQVLEYLYEEANGEPKAPPEINTNLRKDGMGNRTVTEEKILPELGGQIDGNWNQRPLIKEIRNGWRLTAYGELLSYTIFNKEPWTKLHYAPDKEGLVKKAKEEVGMSV